MKPLGLFIGLIIEYDTSITYSDELILSKSLESFKTAALNTRNILLVLRNICGLKISQTSKQDFQVNELEQLNLLHWLAILTKIVNSSF